MRGLFPLKHSSFLGPLQLFRFISETELELYHIYPRGNNNKKKFKTEVSKVMCHVKNTPSQRVGGISKGMRPGGCLGYQMKFSLPKEHCSNVFVDSPDGDY